MVRRLLIALVRASPLLAQQPNSSPQPQAVLQHLNNPAYPPLARQARIAGEVELSVSIQPDGSVASVRTISGHPMLAAAANSMTLAAKFDCHDCLQAVERRIVFSFELFTGDCCGKSTPGAAESLPTMAVSEEEAETHVVLRAQPGCICDPGFTLGIERVRSLKCLYLWHCSTRYPL